MYKYKNVARRDKRIAVFSLGVPLPDIEKAIDILNHKNNGEFFFKIFPFEQIKKLFENDIETQKILNVHSITIKHVTCVIADHILPVYERIRQRLEHEYLFEFLIVITPFSLFSNEEEAASDIDLFGSNYAGFFVMDDNNKCCIISTKNLDEFTKKAEQPLKISVALLLINSLVMLFTEIDPENAHLDRNGNPTSVGCLNDFCESLDEIIPSLMSQKFCEPCSISLKQSEIGKSIIERVDHIRNLPWYYAQPFIFWLSLILLPLGLLLLATSKIYSIPLIEPLGTVSSVVGSFLLGLSQLVKKGI